MEESRLKITLRMAFPAVLESVFISLAGMIDTLMVSQLGPYAVAAVGLTTQPKFIFLAFFIAYNIAVSALTARRRGEGRRDNANEIFLSAMRYTLIMNLIITLVCVVFAGPMMTLCGSNADTHEAAVVYFRIIMGGTAFNTISLVINAAQRGSGNTKIAMVTNVVSSIANVILNWLLITGHCGFPALGMQGAAIATVIGTVVAMILSIRSLFHKDSFISVSYIREHHIKPIWQTFKNTLSLAINFFFENVAMRVGFLATALFAAKLGTDAFAAHQVGMNILNLGFSFGDGMQVAAVALIGRSLGQGDKALAKSYGVLCQKIGLFISLVLAILMFVGGREFFTLFFQNADNIVDIGVIISRYIMVILLFQISQIIYSGCLRGAGDARYTLVVALISVTIIRTLVTVLLTVVIPLGIHGIWSGVLSDQISRFVLNCARFRSGKWANLSI